MSDHAFTFCRAIFTFTLLTLQFEFSLTILLVNPAPRVSIKKSSQDSAPKLRNRVIWTDCFNNLEKQQIQNCLEQLQAELREGYNTFRNDDEPSKLMSIYQQIQPTVSNLQKQSEKRKNSNFFHNRQLEQQRLFDSLNKD